MNFRIVLCLFFLNGPKTPPKKIIQNKIWNFDKENVSFEAPTFLVYIVSQTYDVLLLQVLLVVFWYYYCCCSNKYKNKD